MMDHEILAQKGQKQIHEEGEGLSKVNGIKGEVQELE